MHKLSSLADLALVLDRFPTPRLPQVLPDLTKPVQPAMHSKARVLRLPGLAAVVVPSGAVPSRERPPIQYDPMPRPLPGPDVRSLDERLQATDRDPAVPWEHKAAAPLVVDPRRATRRKTPIKGR